MNFGSLFTGPVINAIIRHVVTAAVTSGATYAATKGMSGDTLSLVIGGLVTAANAFTAAASSTPAATLTRARAIPGATVTHPAMNDR